ncbi:MAG TPA: hypothetical protein VFX91_12960 [Alcanivorax sp.]|nr:hypothetical protein [Alcanivorax sp.]
MRNKSFYVFLIIFSLMFLGSVAMNLLTDRVVYLAPVIGLAGMVWSLLRLRGITHIAGLRIGRDDEA